MTLVTILRIALAVVLLLPTAAFLLSKCFFAAPYRIGRLMWMGGLVYETIEKKYHRSRLQVDALLFPILSLLWLAAGGPWVAFGLAILMGIAWGWTLLIDMRSRSGGLARQDSRHPRVPIPIPSLILNLRGPILERGRICSLGQWPVGHQARFEAIVLNPSLVKPQWPMKLEVIPSSVQVKVTELLTDDMAAPDPGQAVTVGFILQATQIGGSCDIVVRLTHGDYVRQERLHLQAVLGEGQARPLAGEIRRWKGGCRAAFGWRGDHDMYDPATFQDAEGLRMAFGLARRFCLPSTVYLSARLSLVPEEHRQFCEHFGWDRRTQEIPEFVRFLREEVEITPEMEWPHRSERPYYAEIGNHMYHHYGTHASAAPGNNWQRSSIGAGDYPWLGPDKDDFSEQRDNAAKCNEVFKEVLGIVPMSFSVPGRDYSENTAAAVEAAGIRVGSDSDASQWLNVMGLPRPHHPKGVKQLVDITKKYPGDCDNVYKIAMLKYWLHLAQREGVHFLYMAHQHMLRYFSNACYHLTEEMFRYVLDDCHGDFYPATVSRIAMYWERVLCPEHKVVHVRVRDGEVTVENSGDEDMDRIPVELNLGEGKRMMVLVDVPAGGQVSVSVGRKA